MELPRIHANTNDAMRLQVYMLSIHAVLERLHREDEYVTCMNWPGPLVLDFFDSRYSLLFAAHTLNNVVAMTRILFELDEEYRKLSERGSLLLNIICLYIDSPSSCSTRPSYQTLLKMRLVDKRFAAESQSIYKSIAAYETDIFVRVVSHKLKQSTMFLEKIPAPVGMNAIHVHDWLIDKMKKFNKISYTIRVLNPFECVQDVINNDYMLNEITSHIDFFRLEIIVTDLMSGHTDIDVSCIGSTKVHLGMKLCLTSNVPVDYCSTISIKLPSKPKFHISTNHDHKTLVFDNLHKW